MKTEASITGIVLAGGKSRRMGVDKGLMLYWGRPLIQYSLDLLNNFCSRILISSNNPEYQSLGYEVITDKVTGAGPMAGIASCIELSKSAINIVLSCDMPLIEPVILHTLLKHIEGNTFVVPLDHLGRAEPLCAVYHLDSLPLMKQLIESNTFRMTGLYLKAPVKYIEPTDYPVPYNKLWFSNFNSLDDIKAVDKPGF